MNYLKQEKKHIKLVLNTIKPINLKHGHNSKNDIQVQKVVMSVLKLKWSVESNNELKPF